MLFRARASRRQKWPRTSSGFAKFIRIFSPVRLLDKISERQMIPQLLETKASEADRWTTLPERGTPASLRMIAWIAVHIGRRTARLLLYPVTLYFVITARAARSISYKYLKRVRGGSARCWHIFRHFHCFAATILDRVYL